MTATTQNMTVDEFFEYASKNGRCELINGEVRTLSPTGERHGRIAARLIVRAGAHAQQQQLGEVYSSETGFVVNAELDTVRAPDFAFIRADRLDSASTPRFCPIAPDLVAEVVSPSDKASDVTEKTQLWLRGGVRLVWIVDAATRTVTAYHPDGAARVLSDADTLAGEDVLPGFELPIRELFD